MKSLWSKIALGLMLGLAVIIGLALFTDIRAVVHTISGFHWPYLPAILGLTLFNYSLRFLKWHYFIRLIGACEISWLNSLRIFVGGFPLALSPGKLAEPLKAVWLRHYSQVPVARAVPVVAAERLSGALAVLLMSTVGVVAYPQYWPGFAVMLAGLLGVIIVSQIRPLALWLIGLGERLRLVARFSYHLREFYEGTYRVFGLCSTALAVGLGIFSWLGYCLGFYLVLRGLGLPPSLNLAATAVFVLSFGAIMGAVSTLPGGLGAAEVSITGLLLLSLPGIHPQLVASAALLIRFFTVWLGVALGLIVLAASRHMLTLEIPASGERI